jgi:hypothetical protein
MQIIPPDILSRFDSILKQRNIPLLSRHDYRKWLRYFLDFRAKYPLPGERSVQVRLFSDKLRSKGQTDVQVEQAAAAVSLFFASDREKQACPGAVSHAVVPGLPMTRRRQGRIAQQVWSRKEAGVVCEPPGEATPVAPQALPGYFWKTNWKRNFRTPQRVPMAMVFSSGIIDGRFLLRGTSPLSCA